MNPVDPTCDEFLEAGMGPAQRSRFRSRSVPSAAADLYGDVESSLRRSFAVPDLSNLIGRVEAAAAQMRQGGRDAIEGTIRWFAAAASLLFMFMTVCVSTLLAPVSDRVEGESTRGWSSTLVEAVGMGLSTASALVASGGRLRRNRDGRMRSHRFGASVMFPPVSGGPVPVEWVGRTVTRLVATPAGQLGGDSRPDRPQQPDLPQQIGSIDDRRRYFRRESNPIPTSDAVADNGFAPSRRVGCGAVSAAA